MNKSKIYMAFAEVDDIIMHTEQEIQIKIPNKLKKIFKDNKDLDYVVKIDYSKDINEQELLLETREIIALIYRDYLCSQEEKNQLIEEHNRIQKEIEEKYDITKIFEQRNNKNTPSTENLLPMKIDEIKWYQKIINKIKSFFDGK